MYRHSTTYAYSYVPKGLAQIEFCTKSELSVHMDIYTVSEKDCTLFLFFFSRCPVCGEWCKLHCLLLDTPSFD